MFRTALSRTGHSAATAFAIAQRPAVSTQVRSLAAFSTSASNSNTNKGSNSESILSVLRSSTSSNPGNKSSGSSLFPNRNSAGNFNNRNSDFSLFGMSSNSARPTNVTSNPIHLDINHRTQGRSFRVGSMAAADSAYRRLRITLNQSNMKRELRLKRTYETGHRRMRREAQEQNQRLFGKMVRKKIDLIKLMKLRGM